MAKLPEVGIHAPAGNHAWVVLGVEGLWATVGLLPLKYCTVKQGVHVNSSIQQTKRISQLLIEAFSKPCLKRLLVMTL